MNISVYPFPICGIPFLGDPVSEYFITAGWRCRRCSCRSFRSVDIDRIIGRCVGSSIGIVFNIYPGCAIESCAPLSIDIQFRSDPETAFILILIHFWIYEIAVDIIRIRHVAVLIVRRFDVVLIYDIGLAVECLCARFIQEPSYKLVAVQSSGQRTYSSTLTDTEAEARIWYSPIDISRCAFRIIGMQEYTMLFLAPLGIDLDASNRHCGPCVFRGAAFI